MMNLLLDVLTSTFKKGKELLASVSLVLKNEGKNENSRKMKERENIIFFISFFFTILDYNCYYVALKVVTFM